MAIMSVSGLVSGLDTRELITELMKLERRPLQRLETQQQLLQAKKEAWQEINTALYALRNTTASLRERSLYIQNSVSSTDEEAVTATATAAAEEREYRIEVSFMAQSHVIASDSAKMITADADADQNTALNLTGTLMISVSPGEVLEIAVAEEDSLKSIAEKINSAEESAVSAALIDNRLVLEAKESGLENVISISSTGSGEENELAQALGFLAEDGELKNELQEARNACFSVNGLEVERASNTVSDLVEGLTFTLKKEGASATVSVKGDHERIIEKIKTFIKQYNAANELIRAKTEMNLEERSRGILYGEGSAVRIRSTMRSMVTGRVSGIEGSLNSLAAIGITTVKWGELETEGNLTLDEDKLRELLAENPQAVAELFRGEDGVARRLESYLWELTRASDGLIAVQRSSAERQIRSLNTQKESWERRLKQREAQLERQFLAMEKALGQMMSQGNWLEKQINYLSSLRD
ncbi:MAG: flagellar filament capping protein FliD [Dethiobacteria bacterium]